MGTIVICILTVVMAALAIGAFFLNMENRKLREQMNKQEAENAAENKSKNEIKESMETGNSYNDFNNSINVLHDLAGKK